MTEGQNTASGAEKLLDNMTVKELRTIAKDFSEITGFSAMKKEDLLIRIKEAQGKLDAKPKNKNNAGKKAKKIWTVQDVKQEIIKLRNKKIDAQNDADKKNVEIIRRRISRLKKKSRKNLSV